MCGGHPILPKQIGQLGINIVECSIQFDNYVLQSLCNFFLVFSGTNWKFNCKENPKYNQPIQNNVIHSLWLQQWMWRYQWHPQLYTYASGVHKYTWVKHDLSPPTLCLIYHGLQLHNIIVGTSISCQLHKQLWLLDWLMKCLIQSTI